MNRASPWMVNNDGEIGGSTDPESFTVGAQ
jgi:hypothetical protein